MGKQIAVEIAAANVKKSENGPGKGFAHQKGLSESVLNANRFSPLDQLALGILGGKKKISILQIGGSKETAKATEEFFQKEGVLVEMKAVHGNFAVYPLKEGVLFDMLTEPKRIDTRPNEFDYIVAFGVKDPKALASLIKGLKTGGVMFDDSKNGTHPPTIQMHKNVLGEIETAKGNLLDEH